ncbi:MAG: response regulator [Candidatus Omnitrophota bacterium]
MMKPRIVAIDDEKEFAGMLLDYFAIRGYDIGIASRAAPGIEMIKESRPDVVLCDFKMPGIDGDEILGLTRTLAPAPKVIFVTAYYDGGSTRIRLLNMGAYAYFDKPITSLKALEEAINRSVNG